MIPVEQAVDQFDIVIPGKSLTELSRSLTNEEEIVEISIMENQVLFKTENMYFYSRLLEGNYPDTNRLIPSSFNTEVEFSDSMDGREVLDYYRTRFLLEFCFRDGKQHAGITNCQSTCLLYTSPL